MGVRHPGIDRGFRGSARGTAVPLSHPRTARRRYARKPRETCGRSRSRKCGLPPFSIGIPVTLAKHRGPIDPVRTTPPEGDAGRERSNLVAGRVSTSPENPEAGFRTRVSPAKPCNDAETPSGSLTQRPVSDLPAGTGYPAPVQVGNDPRVAAFPTPPFDQAGRSGPKAFASSPGPGSPKRTADG